MILGSGDKKKKGEDVTVVVYTLVQLFELLASIFYIYLHIWTTMEV